MPKPKVQKKRLAGEPQKAAVQSASAIGVPGWVKVISVLYYIGAVFYVIAGILMMVGASLLGSLTNQVPLSSVLGGGLLVVGGILFLAFGIFAFFIARGLWKGHNWARVAVIVLVILGLISGLVSIVSGNFASIVGFLINLLIGWYMTFNQRVKAAFGKA